MRSLTSNFTGKGDVGGGLLVLAELLFQVLFLIVRKARGFFGFEARALGLGRFCSSEKNLFVWMDGALDFACEGEVWELWLFKRVSFALRTRCCLRG